LLGSSASQSLEKIQRVDQNWKTRSPNLRQTSNLRTWRKSKD